MEFTAAFNWQLMTVMLLVVISLTSKFFGKIQLKQFLFPAWVLPFIALIMTCIAFEYLRVAAIPFIAILIICGWFIDSKLKLMLRVIAGVTAGVIFLAMGFHVLPGFENQLIIDAQHLKGDSTTFTKYYNFDKTLGGLIFFLLIVPSPLLPSLKQINQSAAIMLAICILVLLGGVFGELIRFNSDYLFKFSFILFFIYIQIFSVCLAEETFFRGFIQYRLTYLFVNNHRLQSTIPLMVTSIFFGLVHYAGGLGYVIASTVAGLGYGLVYQLTQRIEYSIIAHMLLNFLHLIFFTYPFAFNV